MAATGHRSLAAAIAALGRVRRLGPGAAGDRKGSPPEEHTVKFVLVIAVIAIVVFLLAKYGVPGSRRR